MKCKRHNDREVVALCAECNAGVCAECAQATADLRDECGTLCIDCYTQELSNAANYYETRYKKRMKKIIGSIVMYIIGIILILASWAGQAGQTMIIGVVLCGFYPAIAAWKKAEAEHEEYERRYGVSYTVTSSGVYREDGFFVKVLKTAIFAVLGLILTPINIIKEFIGRAKDKKCFESLIAEMNRVQYI